MLGIKLLTGVIAKFYGLMKMGLTWRQEAGLVPLAAVLTVLTAVKAL